MTTKACAVDFPISLELPEILLSGRRYCQSSAPWSISIVPEAINHAFVEYAEEWQRSGRGVIGYVTAELDCASRDRGWKLIQDTNMIEAK